MEDFEDPYTFKLAGIEKALPDPSQIPPLLKRFGTWVSSQPWPAVGSYSLEGGWADQWFAGSEYFYKDFAMFIWLPTGSVAGYWLKGRPVAESPIVLFGSEGERQVLAPNLESLLARIALNDFGPKAGAAADFVGEDDEVYEDGEISVRGEMQAFLRRETGIDDLAPLAARAHPEPTDLADWVEGIEKQRRAELAKDPDMQAVREILAKYRPVDAETWASTAITLYWAGDDFEGEVLQQGPQPLAEAARLKPHFAVLRDRTARQMPGLGLWHCANLFVYADMIEFRPYYMEQPKFRSAEPSADAYKADHARMPREARRIPPWLAAILAS